MKQQNNDQRHYAEFILLIWSHKNCPHKDTVSRYLKSGQFCHDVLKIYQDLPDSYTDNFPLDKIKDLKILHNVSDPKIRITSCRVF